MSSYFDHYRRVNRLDDAGRRASWGALDSTVAHWLPHDRGARVLDIGCGAGIALEWLRARGWVGAAGVDIDADQVAFARSLGLPVEQVTDVAGWLARAAHEPALDFVLLRDVLEHVPDAPAHELLAAIAARLAPEGRALLTVPNASGAFASRMRYIDPTHLRAYTEHSLTWDLERAGLELVHLGGDDSWRPASVLGAAQLVVRAVFRSLRRLEAMAEFGAHGLRFPLSTNLLAVVRAAR